MNQVKIDEKWVAWVQENLARGTPINAIVDILANNFSIPKLKANEAVAQIKRLPKQQPVVQSSNTQEALDRREWMMKTLDKMARLASTPYAITRVPAPPFREFVDLYYSQNKPVLLENAIEHWPARTWTPDSLLQVAQDQEIQVQFDRESNSNFEMDSLKHKKTMRFSEYHHKVQTCGESNNFYMTANNAAHNQPVMAPLFKDVKDVADGYFDESRHVSRSFIWYGPKGNYTPLHHDQTNNMFVQVFGRKRFLLLPPNQVPYLYNECTVFSPVDLRNIDAEKYPLAKNTTPIELVLNPGDTLFIPVGWWHQVESLDISISITMTNFKILNSLT